VAGISGGLTRLMGEGVKSLWNERRRVGYRLLGSAEPPLLMKACRNSVIETGGIVLVIARCRTAKLAAGLPRPTVSLNKISVGVRSVQRQVPCRKNFW
jgi:hypothetical protein